MSKMQTSCQRVRMLLQAGLILLPMLICYYWLTVNTSYSTLRIAGIAPLGRDFTALAHTPLSIETRLLATFASLLFCLILMYALKLLITLFRHYENNEIFTTENASIYEKLGRLIFLWVIAGIIYGGVMSLIMSFNNPPGERMIQLEFIGVDVLTLIVGMIVLVIAKVMKQASQLAEDNKYTI